MTHAKKETIKMKITKEQLKQIIKEELSAIMEEPLMEKTGNQLIDNDGYEVYLQAPLYIKGDFSSPLDGPWNQAEAVKQALRKVKTGSGVDANRGLDAVNKLQMMTSQGHDSINPNKKEEIMDFLQYAFDVLSRS